MNSPLSRDSEQTLTEQLVQRFAERIEQHLLELEHRLETQGEGPLP